MDNDDFIVLVSEVIEGACVLCSHRIKMTERVEQQICIIFCIKFERSSPETIRMTQKAAAMGNW